jgi:hypothetical protein
LFALVARWTFAFGGPSGRLGVVLLERLVFEEIVIGIVEFEFGAIGLGGLFLANDGTGGSTGHEVELFVGVFALGMGWSMVSNENQRFL